MIIVAENLTKTYRSGDRSLTVLDAIDLTVAAGEIVAVVGPSGSGKTTLLGLLAGLDLPTDGDVTLDGQRLGGLTEDQRARLRSEKIGFVFQTFQLIPTLTALENVAVPIELRNGRAGGTETEARAADLLERVGLGHRLGHYPSQLSGGEQQRVGLARAFANRPRILMADEPTGNLDADTGRGVTDLMIGLNREAGTTLLLVTHDPALAARADRTVRLQAGRLVRDDGTADP